MLNDKEFNTDQNGYFDFGFPQGEHEFLVNNEDIITITIIPHETTSQNFYIGGEIVLGDVNNDGTIDVLDIILVVNFIMDTSNPNNQEIWCSDLNGDTNINIQDIILLINIILESN